MAANEAEQAAAPTNARPAPMLHPELFMAARCGDSNLLKELLRLKDDEGDEQAGTLEPPAVAPVATAQQVVVEVGRWAGAAAVDPTVVVVAVAAPQQVVEEVDPRPAAPMDPTVMAAAQVVVADAPPATSSGAASLRQLLDGVTSNEGDSVLHVVAACGDGDEFLNCATMIYRGESGLLAKRNNKGDTPLHCAAGAGNANMVSCLVDLASSGGETAATDLLRMRNKGEETALHQAVRAASKASIDRLISKDPELACIPREGEKGASPLYLAISLGEVEIARHLFHTSEAWTKAKLSYYSGPDGRNALHAVVSRGQALPMLFEWFKDVTVNVREGDRQHMSSVSLLSQLAVQRDDLTGSTPLHLSASLSGWPFMDLISRWFPHVLLRPGQVITLLLDANMSCVCQPDNEGLYPIHVAAMTDGLAIVAILLQRCPDCATLRDAKGRTFLHVAVEKESYRVVRYACRVPQLSSILNVQDNEGDTALHRAIDVGNLGVFNCLIRNPHVRLDVSNNKAQRPLDLSWSKIPPGFGYGGNARRVIQQSLAFLGAPCGESRADLFYDKHVSKRDKRKESKQLAGATQAIGIVCGLVATVTFASAFTLPGGYYQSSSDGVPGTPILAGSYAFDAFILSNALAFFCSCVATFNIIFAGKPTRDNSMRNKYMTDSFRLMRSAVRSLMVAFALGLYVVLAPLAHGHTITIAVLVILSSCLLFGHPATWRYICAADNARARLGIRQPQVWVCVLKSFDTLLVAFWPFIIIFGLPAIRQIKVHHTS